MPEGHDPETEGGRRPRRAPAPTTTNWPSVPAPVGWLVLLGVFAVELIAALAVGIGGWEALGVPGAVLGVLVVVGLWATFASPRAPRGGPVARPMVKLLVLGAATTALWVSGHASWAIAFLGFSLVVNALAQLPSVKSLASPPR